MLAVFVRCVFEKLSAAAKRDARLSDLNTMLSRRNGSAGGSDATNRALRDFAARLEHDDPTLASLGCRSPRHPGVPSSFRYVQESVANTLGFPALLLPRDDHWVRLIAHQRYVVVA